MKRTTVLVYAAASLFCWLAGAMMWAQSDQPSLADVARQKSTAKARRVVTNDEIPPNQEASNPSLSSSAGEKSAMLAEKLTTQQQLMAERDSLEKIIKQMQEKIDAIIFGSALCVKNLFQMLKAEASMEKLREIMNGKITIVAIGPVTAKALMELGVKVDVMPEKHVFEEALAALARYWKNK